MIVHAAIVFGVSLVTLWMVLGVETGASTLCLAEPGLSRLEAGEVRLTADLDDGFVPGEGV